MSEWLKDLKEGQHIRVTGDKEGVKDRSALPRTLDVFMENGEVKVMVLCKMKEGQATIGQGEFKLVRAAVDWSNGEMYVDAVLKQKSSANRQYEVTPEIEAEVLKEFSCYESVGGKPGISARPMGLHNYTVKNAQGAEITKTSFYQPYYPNGNLLSFIVKKQSAGELDFQTQVKIFRGVLSGVDTLKNNNILHRDLKEDNMYMDNEYNPKIADFGCADTIKDPTLGAPKLTETEYREMIDKGNAGSRSPEQWLIERYRRFGVEATPEILKFDAEINANRAKSRALVQSNPKAFDTPEYKALLKEHGELVAKRKGRIEELNKSWSQTIPMLWYSNCGKSETYSAGVTCVGMVLRQIVNTPEGKLNRFAARFSEVLENAAKEVTFTKEDPVNHQLKSKPFREFSSEYYARVQVALNDYVARAVSECNPPLTAEQMQLLELGMQLLTCDPNARTTTNQALSRLSDIEQRYAPAH
jgi:serine/threonine protein kinase